MLRKAKLLLCALIPLMMGLACCCNIIPQPPDPPKGSMLVARIYLGLHSNSLIRRGEAAAEFLAKEASMACLYPFITGMMGARIPAFVTNPNSGKKAIVDDVALHIYSLSTWKEEFTRKHELDEGFEYWAPYTDQNVEKLLLTGPKYFDEDATMPLDDFVVTAFQRQLSFERIPPDCLDKAIGILNEEYVNPGLAIEHLADFDVALGAQFPYGIGFTDIRRDFEKSYARAIFDRADKIRSYCPAFAYEFVHHLGFSAYLHSRYEMNELDQKTLSDGSEKIWDWMSNRDDLIVEMKKNEEEALGIRATLSQFNSGEFAERTEDFFRIIDFKRDIFATSAYSVWARGDRVDEIAALLQADFGSSDAACNVITTLAMLAPGRYLEDIIHYSGNSEYRVKAAIAFAVYRAHSKASSALPYDPYIHDDFDQYSLDKLAEMVTADIEQEYSRMTFHPNCFKYFNKVETAKGMAIFEVHMRGDEIPTNLCLQFLDDWQPSVRMVAWGRLGRRYGVDNGLNPRTWEKWLAEQGKAVDKSEVAK
jgi:hypothetical protein